LRLAAAAAFEKVSAPMPDSFAAPVAIPPLGWSRFVDFRPGTIDRRVLSFASDSAGIRRWWSAGIVAYFLCQSRIAHLGTFWWFPQRTVKDNNVLAGRCFIFYACVISFYGKKITLVDWRCSNSYPELAIKRKHNSRQEISLEIDTFGEFLTKTYIKSRVIYVMPWTWHTIRVSAYGHLVTEQLGTVFREFSEKSQNYIYWLADGVISAAELTFNLNVQNPIHWITIKFPFQNAMPKCSVPKCRYALLLSAMIMVWMGEWGMQNLLILQLLSVFRH
jgi:hypothetical protein